MYHAGLLRGRELSREISRERSAKRDFSELLKKNDEIQSYITGVYIDLGYPPNPAGDVDMGKWRGCFEKQKPWDWPKNK